MQLVPKYLLNNSVSLIANLAGEVTEYRPVYTRNINVVRGIDNTIQFNVLNADQKAVSILNTYTPKFKAYDENNRLVVERDGTVIETATTKKGHFTVTITENDLLNLPAQYLSYTVFLENSSTNAKTILSSGTNFNNRGTIQIQAEEFPGPIDSDSISTFTEDMAIKAKKEEWEGFILRQAEDTITFTMNGKPKRKGSYKFKFIETTDCIVTRVCPGSGKHEVRFARFRLGQYEKSPFFDEPVLVDCGWAGGGRLGEENMDNLTSELMQKGYIC